ncbi:hypothetical protein BVRB_9g217960 [Beta vulgaris subsp. vulgaris]|nr:hypothetical protein BVRB_9g217960 [Beta vulgaris subsp. vulgaris]
MLPPDHCANLFTPLCCKTSPSGCSYLRGSESCLTSFRQINASQGIHSKALNY